MKILYGQDLSKELRRLSDKVSKRFWIAVPYIGGPTSVRRIIGKEWFDSPAVNVKFLTDTTDLSCINTEMLQLFHDRGEIKTLTGLHAKIYIVDEESIVTSANLTFTAFSKRHEIGMLCNYSETQQIINIYNEWWRKAENVKIDQLNKIFAKKHDSKEETNVSLPIIFDLPIDPGPFIKNPAKRFLNYNRLVDDYKDFAKKYSSIQRIWKEEPLFFEIDGLFNYLYHEAPRVPSFVYGKKAPRKLSSVQQMIEIEKWAVYYRDWNNKWKNEYGDDIEWRLRSSRKLKSLLSERKILKLDKEEIETVFRCLNSLNSYPINRTKILNNNSVPEIRRALNELVNGKGELAGRMDFCNNIKSLGTSSMNEILGFTSPQKYPLINKNSNCGLRFFGYQIRAYN